MERIIRVYFVVLQLAVLVLPVRAQTYLQLILEDFAGHDQGVASGKTLDPFPVDPEAELQYFVIDIDANGVNEIFVSRPDLASDGLWGLYRDQLEDGKVVKVGIVELYASNIRMGERDGVRGYYEYHPVSGTEGNLLFNSFDEDGDLVALWEAVVEPQGKDKALMDSLHLGRFDPKARKPEVKILPLRPVWESYVKRKQAPLREGSGSKASMRAIPQHPPSQLENENVNPSSVAMKTQSNSWVWWLFAGGLSVIIFVAWRCRDRFRC
jgi:hypothetical protein